MAIKSAILVIVLCFVEKPDTCVEHFLEADPPMSVEQCELVAPYVVMQILPQVDRSLSLKSFYCKKPDTNT